MNSVIQEHAYPQRGGFSAICTSLLATFLLLIAPFFLQAEGSKDFVNYPGNRLFLDTRDDQQLKVYAIEGEFINVGGSHVGIMGGFIELYRPDGTLHATFDGSNNLAIINNNIEEQAGPTGGGTTNGAGYIPGVVEVATGQAGIWTIRFDFPGEDNNSFINLQNGQNWNRTMHQPANSQRVVLAWDVTISKQAAGNDGGNLLTGRLYSNKYVSVINGNGNETSPNFHILTRDGYIYEVDFQDIDPFRFTLGTNSFGIVDGGLNPAYRSVAVGEYSVDNTPQDWNADSLYLYQLMSEDFEPVINNKVFFNLPNDDLPTSAMVTDIYENNTHTTWLYTPPPAIANINFTNFEFVGLNPDGNLCDPNTAQTGIGGYVSFETTLGGTATLELDLNNDGDFDDPQDRILFDYVDAGVDSIFWDGIDGEGNPLPVGEGFTLNYKLSIRGGEIHIFLIDIENNNGGVTFNLINPDGTTQVNPFYYDHSQVGGSVSGGGLPGSPEPTTTLDTYNGNFGDNKILDYWSYTDFAGNGSGTFTIDILEDCNCGEASTPVIEAISDDGDYCSGADISFTAMNANMTNDTTYFNWSGPNFTLIDTITTPGGVSVFTIEDATPANDGFYYLTLTTPRDCVSERDSIWVGVLEQPSEPLVTLADGDGIFCDGDTVSFAISSTNQTIDYEYSIFAPNGDLMEAGIKGPDDVLQITTDTLQQSGNYQVAFNNSNICTSNSSFSIEFESTPQFGTLNGGGSFCEGEMVVLTLSNPNNELVNYTWTTLSGNMAGGFVDSGQDITLQLQNFNADNAGTYSIQLSSENGCTTSTQDSTTIELTPSPTIGIEVSAAAYCPGEDVIVQASNSVIETGDITYSWAGNGYEFMETIAEGDTSTFIIPEFAVSDAGTYFLNIESACGTQSDVFNVEAFSTLEISSISAPAMYCAGDTITLTGAANLPADVEVIYTWQFPNGTINSNLVQGNEPFDLQIDNINPLLAGEYTLTIEVDGQECDTPPMTTMVEVASVPFLVDVTGGGLYCEHTPGTFSAMNTTPGIDSITYTWTAPNGEEFTNTVGGTDPLEISFSGLTYDSRHGTWTISAVSEDGCEAPEQTIEVEIAPALFIENMTGEGLYCEGDDVTLTAANGNEDVQMIEWNWYLEFNEEQFDEFGTADSTDIFSVTLENITVADTGLYVVVITSEEGCPVGVGTQYVDIEAAPIVGELAGGGAFCEGESTTITASLSNDYDGNVNYTWTGPNGFEQSGVAPANGDLAIQINNLSPDNVGEYFITVTSPNGCVTEWSESVTIETVTTTAALDFNANTDIACFGAEIILEATPYADGTTYIWYFDDGSGAVEIANTTDPTLVIEPVNFDNVGTYYVEVEDANGCIEFQQSGSVEIGVMSGVDAFEDEGSGMIDEQIILNVLENDLYGTNSDVDFTIVTNPQNGTATVNDDGTVSYTPNEGFVGMDSLVYRICSSVCTDVCDETIVRYNILEEEPQDCFIPNFFSPNDDGSNETFFIDCLESQYPENRLYIFNRWGDEIFFAEPYQNDWIGQYKDSDLPAGTYFYMLYLTPGNTECRQGYITIIR